jgi:hypothetical protein
MNRLYLAGKMTGLPENNYPAFHAAAAQLRALGYQVTNPAENPAPPCGSWQGYMRISIPQVCAADAIVMLPGWKDSKGARIEHLVARVVGCKVLPLEALT